MSRTSVRGLVVAGALLAMAGCSQPVGEVSRAQTRGFDIASTSTQNEPTGGRRMRVFLTGYSYWDNTPPGSGAIARPVIHRRAGGIGTYRDPITLAVGHARIGGRTVMDFPAGTRFYIPALRKYAIVEDVCGDGPRPQNGPCYVGRSGHPWIDIYIGGRHTDARATRSCAASITGFRDVIVNPGSGHPVQPGEISKTVCL